MAPGRLLAVFVGLAAALLATLGLAAEPSFPQLTGRIVDQAGVLDAGVRARLDEKLAQLERNTTTQLVVVTLRSLQGYDIADYGYRLGRQWGIGQKGSNNGALLIVVPSERNVRIEVGYGLEGTLTDAVSHLIIQNAMLPRFRAGDFAGGIERGVDDLEQVLSGDAEDFKRRAAEQRDRPGGTEGIGSSSSYSCFSGTSSSSAHRGSSGMSAGAAAGGGFRSASRPRAEDGQRAAAGAADFPEAVVFPAAGVRSAAAARRGVGE